MSRSPKRAAIIDATPLLRRGIRHLLDHLPGIQPGIEASSPAEALPLCRLDPPDLVITDVVFPGHDGVFELLRDLRAELGPIPVLVFSHFDERLMATRALQAGAQGYVMKSADDAEVTRAIQRVVEGHVHLSTAMTDRALDQLGPSHPVGPGLHPVAELTNRELEVLDLVGAGLASKEIAGALHISLKTVETHRAHIRAKLGIDHAAGLISYASQWRALNRSDTYQNPPGAGI